jgi:hypothetical protein
MLKDKELKQAILKALMVSMDDRVAENDLKPRAKMVIKAEGDNPEEIKENVIDKLENLKLPEMKEEDMEEEEMEGEECEMEDGECEEDYMMDMPESLRKALMKNLKKNK